MKHLFSLTLAFISISLTAQNVEEFFITEGWVNDMHLKNNSIFYSTYHFEDAPEPEDGYIYFHRIYKKSINPEENNGASEIIYEEVEGGIDDVEVYGDNLYFTNIDKLYKLNLTDNSVEEFLPGVRATDMLFIGDDMYFFRYAGDSYYETYISKVNMLDPEYQIEDIIQVYDYFYLTALKLYDNHLYYSTTSNCCDYELNRIVKVDYTADTPSQEVISEGFDKLPYDFEIYDDVIYFVTWWVYAGVYQINMKDENPQPSLFHSPQYYSPYETVIKDNIMYFWSGGRFYKMELPTNSLSVDSVDQSAIALYPNPSVDTIHISGITSIQNYSIYNILGAHISSGTTTNKQSIDVSSIGSGIYLLQLENGQEFKFVKQ